MAQKIYNLDTGSSGNNNPCVITPADNATEITASTSITLEIVIPVAEYRKASWVSANSTNSAIVNKTNGSVDIPDISDTGDLKEKIKIERNDNGNPITDFSVSITKMNLSITDSSTAAGYAEAPFNTASKQIKKFDDSGVLKLPNYVKIFMKIDPYGDSDTRLAYGKSYNVRIPYPSFESVKYTFINALTASNTADSAQI